MYKRQLLTSIAQDPIGYGRVLRDAQGHVKRIVEHKDATEEERLQSLNLNVGYQEETDTWEVIVKYTGSLRKLEEIFPDIEVTELSNEYAVIRLPEALMDAVTDRTEIEYMEKPKRLFFSIQQGIRASCITSL